MKLAKYKACICEGSAESAIIDILVDNDLLIFSREEMLDESVIRCRSAKRFEDDDYKNQRRDYYMSDIKADLEWYGNVYSQIGVKNRFEINNDSSKTAVKRLIKEYGLSE